MGTLSEVDRRAIEDCKYRYLRAVDTKDWELLADTVTPDVEASYAGGAFTASGREQLVGFLRESMGADSMHTSHRVTHPELAADGPERARGRWALNDVVIDTEARFVLSGAAFYEDVYARADDGWRIAETRYLRTYELVEPLPEQATMTGSLWQTAGVSSLRL